MKKQIIYITATDKNWLTGLEYFIDERELNYKTSQYTSVEDLLQQSEEIKGNIIAIVLDWELPEKSYCKQKAIEKLEISFPFTPVIAFSEFEFSEFYPNFYQINKKTYNPEESFNTILSSINFYTNDWINNKINYLIYNVEQMTKLQNPTKNIQEKSFFNLNPITARRNAIRYFKSTSKAIGIRLFGFTKNPELEDIFPNPAIGGMVIYSDFLLDREIITNLIAEYRLYKLNGFSTKEIELDVKLPSSLKQFKILKDIANEKGEMLLRNHK